MFVMGKKRELAFEKLKVFLINPGMFSLLVIGDRGVGKRYSIEKAFKIIQEINKTQLEEKCLTELNFIDANSFSLNQSFSLFSALESNLYITNCSFK